VAAEDAFNHATDQIVAYCRNAGPQQAERTIGAVHDALNKAGRAGRSHLTRALHKQVAAMRNFDDIRQQLLKMFARESKRKRKSGLLESSPNAALPLGPPPNAALPLGPPPNAAPPASAAKAANAIMARLSRNTNWEQQHARLVDALKPLNVANQVAVAQKHLDPPRKQALNAQLRKQRLAETATAAKREAAAKVVASFVWPREGRKKARR
jgi:hypothetical protein